MWLFLIGLSGRTRGTSNYEHIKPRGNQGNKKHHYLPLAILRLDLNINDAVDPPPVQPWGGVAICCSWGDRHGIDEIAMHILEQSCHTVFACILLLPQLLLPILTEHEHGAEGDRLYIN